MTGVKICQRCGANIDRTSEFSNHLSNVVRFSLEVDDNQYWSERGVNMIICRNCMDSLTKWINRKDDHGCENGN